MVMSLWPRFWPTQQVLYTSLSTSRRSVTPRPPARSRHSRLPVDRDWVLSASNVIVSVCFLSLVFDNDTCRVRDSRRPQTGPPFCNTQLYRYSNLNYTTITTITRRVGLQPVLTAISQVQSGQQDYTQSLTVTDRSTGLFQPDVLPFPMTNNQQHRVQRYYYQRSSQIARIAQLQPIATPVRVLVVTVSPAEPIDMRGPKEPCVRWVCTLAPPGEYGGSICAGAAMRPLATITAGGSYYKFLAYCDIFSTRRFKQWRDLTSKYSNNRT